MGVNISHGSNQWGQERLSYTSVEEMGEQVRRAVSRWDWHKVSHLFDERRPDILYIDPKQVGEIADILAKAAKHRKMPPGWADTVRRWAAAGYRAWQAGEPWSWR
ncbi:hypothetical protein HYE82_31370 [Streptomyces sp. BR123]|uniref:DUF7739 domain-containing protein n=1 Tax=Streptomyces sp. BR123 TaxID=2749828 RepID=UPI0015C471BC|nr:hypothetical protein [Streptomyces sp. BR123]NXY98802.1 hypothetical protein [Streptomyces sp. BR123]